MRTSITSVFIACMILACTGLVQAQVEKGQQFLSINAGIARPITKTDLTSIGGKNETSVKNGNVVSGQYIYQLTPAWGLGGELGYFKYGDKEHSIPPYITIKNEAAAMIAQAVVRYILMPKQRIYPYIIGGLGYSRASITAKTKPVNGALWTNTLTNEWRDNYDTNISGIVFSLGAGIEGNIGNTIVAGLGFRWFNMGSKKTLNDEKAFPGLLKWKIKNNQNTAITASIGLKFGK